MSIMQDSAPAVDTPTPGDQPDKAAGANYTPPDIAKFIPPEMKDTVDRVVASGMKVMYSDAAKEQVQQAVSSRDEVPKVLSENVVGLMLTLDQQANGGIPTAALFPSAMGLLAEACKVLQTAGKTVTQDDYNNAAIAMYAMIGQKLGGTAEDLTGAAAQSLQGQNPSPGAAQAPQAAPLAA